MSGVWIGSRLVAAAFGVLALASITTANAQSLDVTIRGSSAGSFTSRTSTDESIREPVDAATLLEELPSVHVRRLGGDGSFGTLSVRGSASTEVGVVVAGIPLTSAADPSIDAGTLPIWPGAVYRVHRGFAPASLGATGYLGGVLVIDPPAPTVGTRSEWWALGGSFGTLKLRVGDVRKVGDLAFATGLYASRSDGDFSFTVPDPVTGRLEDRERENAGHALIGGLERVTLTRRWGTVGATIFADASRRGLPGTALAPARVARVEDGRLALGLDARVKTKAGAAHGGLWARRDATTFDDPEGELDPTRPGAHVEQAIEAVGASVGWRGALLPTLTNDIFLDGRAERLVPVASTRVPPTSRAHRLAGGLGADLGWGPLEALKVVMSGRIDARADDADGALGPAGTPLGASTDLAPSGHVGVEVRAADQAVIAAHGGALERPPSFVELYGDRGTLLGDPSLRPERALSADLGVSGDVGGTGSTLGYELVGFFTSARDLIVFVPKGRATAVARNVDEAIVGGAELAASARGRHVEARASYTLLYTENQGDNPLERGRPLPGRPLHDLACDAVVRIGPGRLRYGLDLLAGLTVDAEGTLVLPPRLLHGVGASIEVPGVRGLSAGVTIENLLDVRTQYVPSQVRPVSVAIPLSDYLGFPLPGRAAYGTVRWKL